MAIGRLMGEASIPEILTFARKAVQDLPDSIYTKELHALSLKLKAVLDET